MPSGCPVCVCVCTSSGWECVSGGCSPGLRPGGAASCHGGGQNDEASLCPPLLLPTGPPSSFARKLPQSSSRTTAKTDRQTHRHWCHHVDSRANDSQGIQSAGKSDSNSIPFPKLTSRLTVHTGLASVQMGCGSGQTGTLYWPIYQVAVATMTEMIYHCHTIVTDNSTRSYIWTDEPMRLLICPARQFSTSSVCSLILKLYTSNNDAFGFCAT